MYVEHYDFIKQRVHILHEESVAYDGPPRTQDPHIQFTYWEDRFTRLKAQLAHAGARAKGNDKIMLARDKAEVERNKYRGIVRDLVVRSHIEAHVETKEG